MLLTLRLFTVMPFRMVSLSAPYLVLSACGALPDSFIDDVVLLSESWPEHVVYINMFYKFS